MRCGASHALKKFRIFFSFRLPRWERRKFQGWKVLQENSEPASWFQKQWYEDESILYEEENKA